MRTSAKPTFRLHLEQGVIEMTQLDKPNSRSQRYRLTATGRQWLEAHFR